MAAAQNPETTADGMASQGPGTADQSSLTLMLARDVGLCAVLLSLFAAADTWSLLTGSGLAGFLSVVDGLIVGAGVASLAHEWGHYTGARLSGGRVPLRPLKSFPQVFDFDYKGCEPRHFMALSIGGNVGHWLMVGLLALLLPLDTTGQIALLSGAVGFAVFGSTVEFPVISRAHSGASPLEALSVIPKNFLRKNGAIGAVAALLVFLVL